MKQMVFGAIALVGIGGAVGLVSAQAARGAPSLEGIRAAEATLLEGLPGGPGLSASESLRPGGLPRGSVGLESASAASDGAADRAFDPAGSNEPGRLIWDFKKLKRGSFNPLTAVPADEAAFDPINLEPGWRVRVQVVKVRGRTPDGAAK